MFFILKNQVRRIILCLILFVIVTQKLKNIVYYSTWLWYLPGGVVCEINNKMVKVHIGDSAYF